MKQYGIKHPEFGGCLIDIRYLKPGTEIYCHHSKLKGTIREKDNVKYIEYQGYPNWVKLGEKNHDMYVSIDSCDDYGYIMNHYYSSNYRHVAEQEISHALQNLILQYHTTPEDIIEIAQELVDSPTLYTHF